MVHHGEEVESSLFGQPRVVDDAIEQLVVGDPGKRVVRVVKPEESSRVDDNTGFGTTISFAMNWKVRGAVTIGLLVLLYGTVAVFMAFDRNSHSASDTIRPFVITMGPVWALAIAAASVLLRKSQD